jgi:hypothetical protein
MSDLINNTLQTVQAVQALMGFTAQIPLVYNLNNVLLSAPNSHSATSTDQPVGLGACP